MKCSPLTWQHIPLIALLGMSTGLIAVRWGILSLLVGVLVAGLLGMLLRAGAVILPGVALLFLILLPKSLPALRIGGVAFGWSIGDILIMVAFGGVALRQMVTKCPVGLPRKLNTLDRAVATYCLTLIPAAALSVLHEPDRLVWTIGSIVKAWEILLLYVPARLTVTGKRETDIAEGFFVILVSAVILIAMAQRLFPEAYVRILLAIGAQSTGYSESFLGSVRWRLSGPFLNANTLGTFLIIAVMFVAGHPRIVNMGLHSVFQMTVLAGGLAVLILTLSREAYLGLGVALVYLVITGLRQRSTMREVVLATVLIGLCLLYFLPILYNRLITYTFSGQAPSLQGIIEAHSTRARIDQWVAALHALPSYGILGAGLGRAATAVGEFLPQGSESFGGVHQTYLRALLEGGILELGGLLYLQWAMWRVAADFPKLLCITTRATLLGLMTTGLFGDTFQSTDLIASFLFLLAALQARSTISCANQEWDHNRSASRSFDT